MAGVSLHNVNKRFGSVEIIQGASLEVEDGEFVVFVGPSGCCKSTLLRMIAGLEDISGGEISIGGQVVNDVEPAERECSRSSAPLMPLAHPAPISAPIEVPAMMDGFSPNSSIASI